MAGTAQSSAYMLNIKASRIASMGRVKQMTDEELRERRSQRQRQYYQEHKQEILERNKRYLKEHPEKARKYQERRKTVLKEKISRRQHLYYVNNRDRLLEYSKNWRRANQGKVKEYNRKHGLQRAASQKANAYKNPNLGKAKALFKDPVAAAHLQWLVDHQRQKQENIR